MTFAPEDDILAPAAVKVLRLHTDVTGDVWYGGDGSLGEDSGCSVEEFFDRAAYLGIELGQTEKIRLLGAADNASLLVQLHHRRMQVANAPRIQVCSPALCPRQDDRDCPERVLHALWQPRPCGAMHWHDLGEKDYAAYAVIAALQENNGQPNEKAMHILHYHPAWPALSFPTGYDPYYACLLVAQIVDPRWFRDPLHPHRLSRLHAHLGVSPENAASYLLGQPHGRYYARFQEAVYAMLGRVPAAGTLPYNKVANDPHKFLFRIHRDHLARREGVVHALLACLRHYLRFVTEVWLDNVCFGHRDGGFRPEQFFKTETEVQGYCKHLASLKSRGL